MSDKDSFETVFKATLREGGSMRMSFPLPKELETFHLSFENVRRGIDYYLLARYAFLHRMDAAFMINSFWAVEHLILSVIVLKIKDKEELKNLGGFHSITHFWEEAKGMFPEEKSSIMNKFDNYIGEVKGYFGERYPENIPTEGKLTYTNKMPKVVPGSDGSNRAQKFGKVASLSLDELDHFVSFMLHDVTSYKKDCSGNLMELLASQNNMELYRQDNNYSIIYPNKNYDGEND